MLRGEIKIHFILLLLIFSMNIADYVLTDYALKSGLYVELNPYYRHDVISKILVGVIFTASWLLTSYLGDKYNVKWIRRAMVIILYLLTFIVSAVIVNNVVNLVTFGL